MDSAAVGGSCIEELTSMLAGIFMVQLVVGNSVEHIKPWVAKKLKMKKEVIAGAGAGEEGKTALPGSEVTIVQYK